MTGQSKLVTIFGVVVGIVGLLASPEGIAIIGAQLGHVVTFVGLVLAAIGKGLGVPSSDNS